MCFFISFLIRFMLFEEDDGADPAVIAAFEFQIKTTLFEGLMRITPLMDPNSLTLFPVSIERYVSFAAFIVNSYARDVIEIFENGRDSSLGFLLIDQLLHVAIHSEATVAQSSLRTLESLCESYWRLIQHQQGPRTPSNLARKMQEVSSKLLEWIVSSFLNSEGQRSAVLDRFEALGATLLAITRLSPQR